MNKNISAAEVRLISDTGEQIGIKSIRDALAIAEAKDLDLVEVAPQAKPPVCKIMDYSKYRYELEQKAKKSKKHQTNIVIKEMKLRPKIDKHDYEIKKKHIVRFLTSGIKVKVTIMFRGREIVHTEIGQQMLQRLAEDLGQIATVESQAKLDGRNMIIIFNPIAPKKIKSTEDEKVEVNEQ